MSKEDEKKPRSRGRQKKKRERVGKYVLGKIVGVGGFGTVYEAVHNESGEYVAIKKIRISRRSKEQIESVQSEIDLLRNLSHEHIVRYIGHKQKKKYLFIIMEMCERGSLLQQVKKFNTMKEVLVAKYINQVLLGLEYLHQQGVIHRDIKAANILLGASSVVKLADFGVSAKIKNQKAGNDPAGTPYWMAPEVILMNPATNKCDMWSVGCVVIELLTGNPPYFNLQAIPALYQIVQDPHPPLPENITKLCRGFLEQCFHKNPKIRPSARELRRHPWIRRNVGKRPSSPAPSDPIMFDDGEEGKSSSKRKRKSAQENRGHAKSMDFKEEEERRRKKKEILKRKMNFQPVRTTSEIPMDRRRKKVKNTPKRKDKSSKEEKGAKISIINKKKQNNFFQDEDEGKKKKKKNTGDSKRSTKGGEKKKGKRKKNKKDESDGPPAGVSDQTKLELLAAEDAAVQLDDLDFGFGGGDLDQNSEEFRMLMSSSKMDVVTEDDDEEEEIIDDDEETEEDRAFDKLNDIIEERVFERKKKKYNHDSVGSFKSYNRRRNSKDEDWVSSPQKKIMEIEDRKFDNLLGTSSKIKKKGGKNKGKKKGKKSLSSSKQKKKVKGSKKGSSISSKRSSVSSSASSSSSSRSKSKKGSSLDSISSHKSSTKERRSSGKSRRKSSKDGKDRRSGGKGRPSQPPLDILPTLDGVGDDEDGLVIGGLEDDDDFEIGGLEDDSDVSEMLKAVSMSSGSKKKKKKKGKKKKLVVAEEDGTGGFSEDETAGSTTDWVDDVELESGFGEDEGEPLDLRERLARFESKDVTEPSMQGGKKKEKIRQMYGVDSDDEIMDDEFLSELEFRKEEEQFKSRIEMDRERKLEDVLSLLETMNEESSVEKILKSCNALRKIFKETELKYPTGENLKDSLLRHHGVIPVLDMLDVDHPRVVHAILQVLNEIGTRHHPDGNKKGKKGGRGRRKSVISKERILLSQEKNATLLETLCLIGVIPTVMKFGQTRFSIPIRREASIFVRKICFASPLTLQMFIACRGLRVLSEFLVHPADRFIQLKDIIFRSIDCIFQVFKKNRLSRVPKNDYIRLFAKEGMFHHIQFLLRNILNYLYGSKSGEGSTDMKYLRSQHFGVEDGEFDLLDPTTTEEEFGYDESAEEEAERRRRRKMEYMSSEVISISSERKRSLRNNQKKRDSLNSNEDDESTSDEIDGDKSPQTIPLLSTFDPPPPHIQEEMLKYLSDLSQLSLIFSHADASVHEYLFNVNVLEKLIQNAKDTSGESQLNLIRCVNNISRNPQSFESFEQINGIEDLVGLLSTLTDERAVNVAVNALWSLCRVHTDRQKRAALAGIIPLYQNLVHQNSPVKALCLEILCSFAQVGETTQMEMWKHEGVRFYLTLLNMDGWQATALDSLRNWLRDDRRRVEKELTRKENMALFIANLSKLKVRDFNTLLEPLHRMIISSTKINRCLGASEDFLMQLKNSLVTKCSDMYTRKYQMLIIQAIYKISDYPKRIVQEMHPIVQEIALNGKKKNVAVLVVDIAQQLCLSFEQHLKM